MKEKILIGSNIILTVAVIVLFVLHFQSPDQKVNDESSEVVLPSSLPSGSIVCINLDSLQEKYDMYAEVKKELASKQKSMENELTTKSKQHEQKVREAQEKMQKGLLLRSEAEKLEQELMMEQQGLMQLKDKLNMQYMEEEQVSSRKLMNKVVEYLKEYNKDKGFQYVMSYAFGANLLYVPDSLDITNDVVSGLNEAYKKEIKK